MNSDEIAIYPLSEVKTMIVDGQSDLVLLRIKGGNIEKHFSLRIEDLDRLGKQLCNDAMLLAEHNL